MALCNCIRTAYEAIPGWQLPIDKNPVQKLLIVVNRNEGELFIDELGADDDLNNHNGENLNQNGSDSAESETARLPKE